MNFPGGLHRREQSMHPSVPERGWAGYFLHNHCLKHVDDGLMGLFLAFDIFDKYKNRFALLF